jgi:hypothetical protein
MSPMKRTRAAVFSLVALAIALGAVALPMASGEPTGPTRPTSWTKSQKLDAKPVVHHMKEQGRSATLKTLAKRYVAQNPKRIEYVPRDGAAQRGPSRPTSATAMPGPSQVFDGIANETLVAPPDPTGDISRTQYMEAVNSDNGSLVAVFDRSGDVISPPFRMENLWKKKSFCGKNGQGDPIVQYDQMADRWIVTQFAFVIGDETHGPYYECIAVSASSDATGTYYAYSFLIAKDELPDYPKFGVWHDGYYMSLHLFGGNGSFFTAQGIIAFDRANMLLGNDADVFIFFVNEKHFGLLPADAQGSIPPPAGSPEYLVVLRDDDVVDNVKNDSVLLYEFKVNWNRPGRSEITGPRKMRADPFDSTLCANVFYCLRQKGSNTQLDALGAADGYGVFQMYPLAYRNFGTHESLTVNHSVKVNKRTHRSGINWFEVRDPGPGAVIHQQGTYSPDKKARWVASLGMDRQGNMAMGYALTSKRIFPSIAYAGRLASDPLGEMAQGEQIMVPGRGAQKGIARWGDYTSISIDPVDDCTFWYVNEYYARTSMAKWRTAIGTFRFPGCTDSQPTPSPTASSEPPATLSASP